jgi:hypothetical protein
VVTTAKNSYSDAKTSSRAGGAAPMVALLQLPRQQQLQLL